MVKPGNVSVMEIDGEEVIFLSNSEVAKFFMVSTSTVHSIIDKNPDNFVEILIQKRIDKINGIECKQAGCTLKTGTDNHRVKYCFKHSSNEWKAERNRTHNRRHERLIRSGQKKRKKKDHCEISSGDFLNSDRPVECKTCLNYYPEGRSGCLDLLAYGKKLPDDKSKCYQQEEKEKAKTKLQSGGKIPGFY